MRTEQLEQTLVEMELDTPDIDVWPAVSSRLTRRRSTRVRLMPALAGIAVVVLALMFVDPIRTTVQAWFGLGSTTVRVDEGLAPGTRIGLVGEVVGASVAEAELGDLFVWPVALGEPDAWMSSPSGEVVAVWQPSADLPEIGESGLGALFSVNLDGGISIKEVAASGDARFVDVGATTGLWIVGPHVRIPPSGDPESVGSVLLWIDGLGNEFRLELEAGLDRAVEVAESVGTD